MAPSTARSITTETSSSKMLPAAPSWGCGLFSCNRRDREVGANGHGMTEVGMGMELMATRARRVRRSDDGVGGGSDIQETWPNPQLKSKP
jgi:hypothetical protein